MFYNSFIMNMILVVGAKNTYRSIILAECLKKALKEKGNNGTEVISAGVMAFPGVPAEPEAAEQLKKIGIKGELKSQPLRKEYVLDAGLIITVNSKIKSVIGEKFKDKREIIRTFGEISGKNEDLTAGPGLAELLAKDIEAGYSGFLPPE